jgi:DNA processing protein
MSLNDWLQLSLTDGIGPILTSRIVATTGSAKAAANADRRLLQTVEGIGSAKSTAIADALRRARDEVDAELQRCAAADVSIISFDDPLYPALLKSIPDPPPILYVKGTLEPRDLNAVAIVGSRACTHYGREQAERFAGLLCSAGLTVISGGARGVDSAAHRGAILHPKGRTIAVLGCGMDIVYPPENESLFGQIVERGALMTEFRMGTPPARENFPRRNRIVSGMSRGVLVIEADLASGALITARQAVDDHGRPVFAVPGRVDNSQSAGPHALIRDGAVLTTGLPDILDNLGPLPESVSQPTVEVTAEEEMELAIPKSAPAPRPSVEITERQRIILDGLGNDPTDVDGVIARTDLEAQVVLQELTVLSLKGLVKRVDGQTYARR